VHDLASIEHCSLISLVHQSSGRLSFNAISFKMLEKNSLFSLELTQKVVSPGGCHPPAGDTTSFYPKFFKKFPSHFNTKSLTPVLKSRFCKDKGPAGGPTNWSEDSTSMESPVPLTLDSPWLTRETPKKCQTQN